MKKQQSAPAAEEKETAERENTEEVLEKDLQEAKDEAKDETKAALEAALAEAEENKRKWYSVTAEYENYRRRTANESAQRYREGRADVVKGLFPIADDLERALLVCKDEATKKGVSMVLDAEKIQVIDPLGQPFDAEKHEAILAVEPEEGDESGTVKKVYLKGYEQNGKVLRFAQVVVVK